MLRWIQVRGLWSEQRRECIMNLEEDAETAAGSSWRTCEKWRTQRSLMDTRLAILLELERRRRGGDKGNGKKKRTMDYISYNIVEIVKMLWNWEFHKRPKLKLNFQAICQARHIAACKAAKNEDAFQGGLPFSKLFNDGIALRGSVVSDHSSANKSRLLWLYDTLGKSGAVNTMMHTNPGVYQLWLKKTLNSSFCSFPFHAVVGIVCCFDLMSCVLCKSLLLFFTC